MRLRQPGSPGRRATLLIRLYPRSWRGRYGEEVRVLLETRPPGVRDSLDLVRGALDAHLHPPTPSWIPAIAALSAGALWTAVALVIGAQPVPADWPGYVVDVVPLALAGVLLSTVAIVGAWLRLGDGAGGFGGLAIDVAVVGHGAWMLALLGILVGVDYVASTVLGMTATVIGNLLVAMALIRVGEWPIGGAVAAGSIGLLLASFAAWPVAVGWLGYGLGWTIAGLVELAGLTRWISRPPVARA